GVLGYWPTEAPQTSCVAGKSKRTIRHPLPSAGREKDPNQRYQRGSETASDIRALPARAAVAGA
ncbi:MAG: hypothetical protein ACXVZI_06260, partial [Terriglobales bacterium]